MAFRFVALALGLLHAASGLPALTLQDLEVADDTQSVGSYIREVRAAAPQDYHKTYQNEGDGEVGYSRKKSGGGKKGYQHFDSYQKKAGDNYEFEKQDSFGHDNGGDHGAHSHQHEQRAKPPQGARKYREAEFEEPQYEKYEEPQHELIEEGEVEGKKKQKQKKQHKEHHEEEFHDDGPHHEELKEGANDGNGGVEAHGHDPRDYVLPEKYTWGEESDE